YDSHAYKRHYMFLWLGPYWEPFKLGLRQGSVASVCFALHCFCRTDILSPATGLSMLFLLDRYQHYCRVHDSILSTLRAEGYPSTCDILFKVSTWDAKAPRKVLNSVYGILNS